LLRWGPIQPGGALETRHFPISRSDSGSFGKHGTVLGRTWDWHADPRLVRFWPFLPKPTSRRARANFLRCSIPNPPSLVGWHAMGHATLYLPPTIWFVPVQRNFCAAWETCFTRLRKTNLRNG
jgi:hypothetical protein